MEIISWEKVATTLAGVTAFFAGWLWKDVRTRIAMLEAALGDKASHTDIAKVTARVEKLVDDQHNMALSVSEIKGQVNRIVSHLDSEQRTRMESNKLLMEEIREIRKSVTGMGRRRTKED